MKRRQAGFTLIELMISLVLFSFVIAGVLAVAVSMSQGFREQRASVDAESAVRVPLDFLADAIRQSSPGAPTNIIFDSTTCTSTGVEVVNNVGTGSAANTDRLDVIYAAGAVLTSTREIYATTNQTSLMVNDASQLSIGDSIVVSDTSQGVLLKITNININTLTLAAQNTGCGSFPAAAGPYPTGALVIRAQHAWFYIDWLDGSPMLMMDPDANAATANSEPLAEGVEDLQLVKGIDTNANGLGVEGVPTLVGDEWLYNVAADPPITGTLRAIRVTMIARTLSGLIGNLKQFNRPAAEDHAAAAANSDNFRRRILRTTVEVRNMSVSP